jgi:hypothetical protein
MISRLFPLPNNGAKQTSAPEKALEMQGAWEKPPNPELERP